MRSFFITVILLVASGTLCMAQCDQKVSFTSGITTHLDANGGVKNTVAEQTTLTFDKIDLVVAISRDRADMKLTGKVKSYVCDWKVPFKEGKTTLTGSLVNDNGESRDYTITIEGKDGKIQLLAVSPDEPDDQIKLEADKFQQVL